MDLVIQPVIRFTFSLWYNETFTDFSIHHGPMYSLWSSERNGDYLVVMWFYKVLFNAAHFFCLLYRSWSRVTVCLSRSGSLQGRWRRSAVLTWWMSLSLSPWDTCCSMTDSWRASCMPENGSNPMVGVEKPQQLLIEWFNNTLVKSRKVGNNSHFV